MAGARLAPLEDGASGDVAHASTIRFVRLGAGAPSEAIRAELIRPVAAFSTNARDAEADSEAMAPTGLAVTNPRDLQRFVGQCDARTGAESISTAKARPIGARVH